MRSLDILDSGREHVFDSIVEMASEIADAPIALISLVDRDRQWFKAKVGIEAEETPRGQSFCSHAILNSDQPMIIEDATLDPRFADNPLVCSTPNIRFYAGFPICHLNGTPLGTLCVIDSQPRALDDRQISLLKKLTKQTEHLINQRSSFESQLALHAIENSMDAMFWVREDSSISDVNDRAAENLGYTRERLRKMRISDIDPGFPLEAWPSVWEDCRSKQFLRFETIHRRKDGTTYSCEVTAHYIELNGVKSIFATVRDVSEQKKSASWLRGIYDHSQNLIGLLSLEGELLLANRTALEVGGVEPDQVIGKMFWDTVFWSHSEELQQRLKKSIRTAAGGEQDRFFATHVLPNCEEVELDVLVSPIVINGEIKHLVVEGIDITDANKNIQKIKDAEKRFREVADINTPCWITESDTGCSWLNRQWVEYTGVPLEDHLGFAWTSVVHPDDLEATNAIYLDAVEKQSDFSLEYRLRRHDGEYRLHRATGRARRDANQKFEGFVGYSVDIQDERTQKLALNKLNAELKKSNEDLERFAFAASHDLQEPLRAIGGFVQLLQQKYDDQLDEQATGYIEKTVKGVERMAKIINGVLSYSRVGSEDVDFELVDLNLVMDCVQSNLGELVSLTSATIEVSQLPTLHGNPSLLTQLLQNLVSNGIKYKSEQPPEIKIWCESAGPNVKLFFQDNGIGIADEYKQQIFGLFKRLHHRSEFPGTGLGLAIVKRIVDRHNGSIDVVDTESGEGSLFIVELPR